MSILAAEAHNPLNPPVGEIIVGVIAFAILYFVLAKFVFPQMEKTLVARREAILAASRQQVINELRGQIGTLAVDLAGRVVGESLADDARRSGTVDRFLSELDGMAASGDGRGATVAESN